MWLFCKTKVVCEADEPKDETEGIENEEPKKGHGGCGGVQPTIRIGQGLKFFVQYKKSKDEDDIRKTCGHWWVPMVWTRLRARPYQH